jgi:NADP-dependent 3-hydroxy acid dehydrogenase YdfG
MPDTPHGLARWKGRVALVTGASAGIGHAIARALGSIGMRVVLTARRADRLVALREELSAKGAEVLVVPADLAGVDGPAQVFSRLREAWGGVDVLINNAGLGRREGLAETDWGHLQRMLDVNVRAATLCLREALRDMEGKSDAMIVNISSIAGHRVPPGGTNTFYAATKHALKALTDGVRMELVARKSRVRVGMISPGMVESEFVEVSAPPGDDGDYPFPPLRVEDVAGALLYMLSVPPHVQIHDIVMRSVHQPN